MPSKKELSLRNPDAQGAALLYQGIKNMLRCDEAEVVSGIAKYVMSQHRLLRIGSELMVRARRTPLPSIMALLGAVTRFLEVRQGYQSEGAIWVARLGNERRAIEEIINSVPELNWTEVRLGRPPDLLGLRALMRRIRSRPQRLLRIARRLHQRHEFFRVLRAIELVGYYARYLSIFQEGRYDVAMLSSHSNPHGIAFNLAARRAGVPVVLITHGMPVRPVAKLRYDLALVHCEAARLTYVEEGSDPGRALIHGRRQHFREMPVDAIPRQVTVGIFLCKDVNEQLVRALVGQLLGDAKVASVLIRPHPKNLWRELDIWIESQNDLRLRRTQGGTVSQDLATVDIVLAGNSSVLIDAVTGGRPAAFVPGLDRGAPDMHQFVMRGLVCSLETAMDGAALKFELEKIAAFYQRPEWVEVLRLFANIDEEQISVRNRFAAELRQLATSRLT
ncbi:MAG TPA: hypothetical protein VJU86_22840 [Pyrinomonadaceae bacterium]|nr:hypothetical protein [Pyrinomonadaceae bacterium]